MKQRKQARIIAFAPNRWDGPWMNRQQLLSRLGSNFNILYTNGLWTVWDCRTQEWKDASLVGEFKLQNSVCIDTTPKWLITWPRWPRLNRWITRSGIKRWVKQLKQMGDGPLIGYVFHPQYYPFIQMLQPDFLVYHAYDAYNLTPEWNEQLSLQEKSLARSADLILASSEVISKNLSEIASKPVIVLPNGVNFTAFSQASKDTPSDLSEIPRPRIGYTGNLNRKVDFDLIAILAHEHPDWHFVFIGGIGHLDQSNREGFSKCEHLQNVHFLGAKDHRQLPAYVSHMDVNIMCYRISNEVWTEGIYPLKLHEYLATGLPVISSDIPAVRAFQDYVEIAHNPKGWELAIEAALGGNGRGDPDGRREIAKQNRWEERTKVLCENILSIIKSE